MSLICTTCAPVYSLYVCLVFVGFCRLLIKENESMLFAKLNHLTRLEFCRPAPWSARYLRGRDAMSFSCLTHLKELCIEEAPATVFLHLAGISTMTRLECGQWEDDIVALTQLHRLEITKCQEDAFEGSSVSNLSKLGFLHLGLIDDLFISGIRLNFSKLQKLPALLELHVTYTEKYFSGPTLDQIGDLDQLKILHISNPQSGRFTDRLMLGLALMKHLVSLHVEVHDIDMWHVNCETALLELQAMPCLESMTWTSSAGTFPIALRCLARTMKTENKLKGYSIWDSSGVYVE